jgi:nucleotide-binding universal stress UspA family protein
VRLTKVVIGLDLSEQSVSAARWIASSFAPAAEIILAHVIDVPRMPEFLGGVAPTEDEILAAATDFAEARLHELGHDFTERGVRTELRIGRPHEELTNLAADVGADLLVLGPHGDRPRPWKMLGTTADRTVRSATTPVLVMCGSYAAAPSRLLVALDDGPAASEVLAHAKRVADEFAAQVTVIHVLNQAVVSPSVSVAATIAPRDQGDVAGLENAVVEQTRQWLEATTAARFKPSEAEVLVRIGPAGDAILKAAREGGADLIVMGRGGTGALLPALLGSTLNTVLHGSACPVLIAVDAAAER